MEFHGSDKKCNFFGTLLCTNLNIILNKNKIFIGKIKENQVGEDRTYMQIDFRTNKKKFWFNLQR